MAEMFTVEEEVKETQPDGRIFLIAAKGSRIPMAEARRLGLVKSAPKPGPSETKESAPAETKTASTKKRGSKKR